MNNSLRLASLVAATLLIFDIEGAQGAHRLAGDGGEYEIDSYHFYHSENGNTSSIDFDFNETAPGSGSAIWQVSQINEIAGASGFLFTAGGRPFWTNAETTPLILPPGEGTLTVRYAVSARYDTPGTTESYPLGDIRSDFSLRDIGAAAYDRTGPASPEMVAGTASEPFFAGAHFAFNAQGLAIPGNTTITHPIIDGTETVLYTYGLRSTSVAKGAVFWTAGPSFPGDTPQNPIPRPQPRIPGPIILPPDDELPPEASKPDQIAGIDLVAPIAGGAGTTSTMYVGGAEMGSPTVAASSAAFDDGPAAIVSPPFQEVLITSFGPRFAAFEVPAAAGLGTAELRLLFGSNDIPYVPGSLFDFTPYASTGVAQFSVVGLSPDVIHPDVVGLPFLHGFRFMNDGVADVWEQTLPVPEPHACLLMAMGVGMILQRRVRPWHSRSGSSIRKTL